MSRAAVLALAAYLLALNIAAFAAFGVDKRRARRGEWRVSERTLFLLALLGGSLGAVCGMCAFHHKTKHRYFLWGLPAILLAHCALLYFII